MTPFGFTPDSSDDAEKNNGDGSVDFAAMMQQMQQKIQEEFSKLGVSGPGFAATTEALPKNIVRDTAKKCVTAKGSSPIGANDVSKVTEAFSIAELWLNEATFFPQSIVASNSTLSRSDWVDATLTGWQISVEPLALGSALHLRSHSVHHRRQSHVAALRSHSLIPVQEVRLKSAIR